MRRTKLLVVAGVALSAVILTAAGRQTQPARQPGATTPGAQNTVVLEATIGPDGSITQSKVLRGAPELVGAALEAVRHWVFEPTLLNGVPVPVIMTVSVGFAGNNDTRIPVTAYVDRTGRASIHGPFTLADEFSGGLAAVRMGDGTSGRYGYIDTSGRAVIKPLFVTAGRFSEGLAAVVVDGAPPARWGYIDARGTVAIPPQFAAAGVFADGLAAVKVGDGPAGVWGYVDWTGRLAIDPRFSYAERFADGLAPVRVGSSRTGKWGYIDRVGRFVVVAQFTAAKEFSGGLAAVMVGEPPGRWGYTDKTGSVVIPPQFAEATAFADGLAAVKVQTDTGPAWGYIDKTGAFVIKPTFAAAWRFSEGLAPAQPLQDADTGKWGYIDRTGAFVIAPQFRLARGFASGLAPVLSFKQRSSRTLMPPFGWNGASAYLSADRDAQPPSLFSDPPSLDTPPSIEAELGLEDYVKSRIGQNQSEADTQMAGITYLRYVTGEKHLIFVTERGPFPTWDRVKQLTSTASHARVR